MIFHMQENQIDLNSKTAKTFINFLFWEQIILGGVLLVLGVLRITGVIPTSSTRLLIYNIITLAGGAWFLFDLIWSLVSSKRRKKVSMFDKVISGPASIYLIFFDIYCFVLGRDNVDELFIRLSISIVLFYVAAVLFAQAFYHKKKPAPMTIAAIIETEIAEKEAELEEQKKLEEQSQENLEETKEE